MLPSAAAMPVQPALPPSSFADQLTQASISVLTSSLHRKSRLIDLLASCGFTAARAALTISALCKAAAETPLIHIDAPFLGNSLEIRDEYGLDGTLLPESSCRELMSAADMLAQDPVLILAASHSYEFAFMLHKLGLSCIICLQGRVAKTDISYFFANFYKNLSKLGDLSLAFSRAASSHISRQLLCTLSDEEGSFEMLRGALSSCRPALNEITRQENQWVADRAQRRRARLCEFRRLLAHVSTVCAMLESQDLVVCRFDDTRRLYLFAFLLLKTRLSRGAQTSVRVGAECVELRWGDDDSVRLVACTNEHVLADEIAWRGGFEKYL